MGPLESLRKLIGRDPSSDEALYALVAEEVAAGNLRPGLWAKALMEAEGDETRARARYLYLRVASLKSQHPRLRHALGSLSEIQATHAAAESEVRGIEEWLSRSRQERATRNARLVELQRELDPIGPISRVLACGLGAIIGFVVLAMLARATGPPFGLVMALGAAGAALGGSAGQSAYDARGPERQRMLRRQITALKDANIDAAKSEVNFEALLHQKRKIAETSGSRLRILEDEIESV